VTVKKKVYGITLAFALLFSAAAGIMLADSVKASSEDYLPPGPQVPSIRINSDGSITPETDLISRNGNVYTLTADVNEYQITIERSNIVLDGAGYTLRIANGSNNGVYLGFLTNVTIRNIEIIAFYTAISMHYCSRCHITGVKTSKYISLGYSDYNTVTESTARISLQGDILASTQPNNNLFYRNNLTEIVFTGAQASVESNIFYKNNMLLDYDNLYIFPLPNKVNSWDNGSVGNYWSDYLTRYPNASEIGNTGIGDMPYVIDEDNVDYYPLMYPYDIENDVIAFPTPEPQPSPSPEPQQEPEPFPTTLVATASAATATMIGIILLVYFKKRKH
jgi:hypothetical protein